jgi:maleate cis-trans isomerase
MPYVGFVRPTYKSYALSDLVRLLPEDVGVIPLYAGIREHTPDGYMEAFPRYVELVGELAKIGVDVIHPEGAPPFLIQGYAREQELLKEWQAKYKTPMFTSCSSAVESFNALGVNRIVGVNFHAGPINDVFAKYFRDAGLDFLAMEGSDDDYGAATDLTMAQLQEHVKNAYKKHPTAEAIYLLGSGNWRPKDVQPLEKDLGIPVLHPVQARAYCILTRLNMKTPIKGAGRLLEAMP